jgi:formate dehydrogenase iron-sulfur subunit
VQSCPSAAIRITVVDKEIVRDSHTATKNSFLPASPDPAYTIPTTRYVSKRESPLGVHAADAEAIRPAPPHWPLVFTLVLTQAGIGGIFFEWLSWFGGAPEAPSRRLLSAVLIFAGLGASIFHLGRPLQAWRAFIGVRRSWLSREILAFNALAMGVLLLLATGALPVTSSYGYGLAALVFCSLTGAAALFSSCMVYVDTPRQFWNWQHTGPRFLGTALLLGAGISAIFADGAPSIFAAVGAIGLGKLAFEVALFRNLSGGPHHALARSAKLLSGPLVRQSAFRFGTLSLAIVLTVVMFALNRVPPVWFGWTLFMLLLLSELTERYLFFRAVAQPKMPGGVS